eukprot:83721_1
MAAQNFLSLTDEELNLIILLRQTSAGTCQAVYTILNGTINRNQHANINNNNHNQNHTDHDLEIALGLESLDLEQKQQHVAAPPLAPHHAQTNEDRNLALVLQEQEDELIQNMLQQTEQRQRRRRSEPVIRNRERSNCTICLEQYEGHDEKRVLPCMHVFHKDCIDAWTNRHRTCPICRTNV